MSLPTRGAWIEIVIHMHTPAVQSQSLPTRGAWIEMWVKAMQRGCPMVRSPHGERGLKYFDGLTVTASGRRSPHGERGLKS